MLNRYVYVLMLQLATASACRRYHDLGSRLARWLLMSHDRAHLDHFHVPRGGHASRAWTAAHAPPDQDAHCVRQRTDTIGRRAQIRLSQRSQKDLMNIPVETKPALWGAAAGAAALAFVGFNWGGWTTGGKAESMAVKRVDEAVVAALAPVCVDKFVRASDATANRAALVKLDSWTQGEYVEKGGWAATEPVASAANAASASGTTGPGSPGSRIAAVARACAELLTKVTP